MADLGISTNANRIDFFFIQSTDDRQCFETYLIKDFQSVRSLFASQPKQICRRYDKFVKAGLCPLLS
ncbi:TPA: hypothetical protein DEB00_00820 [Candidatus Uhrbacteria bacterium]|nr:hypothetical protein [Candidatus Uhrbacteria bacterium]